MSKLVFLTFAKVGPSEFVAWHRGNQYVVVARGDRWLVAVNGKAITKTATEGEARVIAAVDARTRKALR